MERIENIGFGDLRLIQDPDQFCYGIDAVILADFASSLYPEFSRAADLGTGNGIIPLILSHKNGSADILGMDVQEEIIEMAERTIRLNGLDERIRFVCKDVSELVDEGNNIANKEDIGFYAGSCDMVTCNPPYFVKGGAVPSSKQAKFIARHETTATVEEFVKVAAMLLKRQGHFFMVHRPSRLADIFYFCRKYGLEPKDMRLVVPKPQEAPNIVLIHCVKGAGKELRVLKELAVYDVNGGYSEEIEKIYERK